MQITFKKPELFCFGWWENKNRHILQIAECVCSIWQ